MKFTKKKLDQIAGEAQTGKRILTESEINAICFADNRTVDAVLALCVVAESHRQLLKQNEGTWMRMKNAFGDLEGFMCECGHQSDAATHYCSNCGRKMSGGEAES